MSNSTQKETTFSRICSQGSKFLICIFMSAMMWKSTRKFRTLVGLTDIETNTSPIHIPASEIQNIRGSDIGYESHTRGAATSFTVHEPPARQQDLTKTRRLAFSSTTSLHQYHHLGSHGNHPRKHFELTTLQHFSTDFAMLQCWFSFG